MYEGNSSLAVTPYERQRGGRLRYDEVEEKMRRYKRKAKEYRARLRVIEREQGREREV